eukprot:5354133-Alexandrium_andersonii.AAC.1
MVSGRRARSRIFRCPGCRPLARATYGAAPLVSLLGVPGIVSAWSAQVTERSLAPSDASWEKEHGELLRDAFPDRFKSFREFDAAKAPHA